MVSNLQGPISCLGPSPGKVFGDRSSLTRAAFLKNRTLLIVTNGRLSFATTKSDGAGQYWHNNTNSKRVANKRFCKLECIRQEPLKAVATSDFRVLW